MITVMVNEMVLSQEVLPPAGRSYKPNSNRPAEHQPDLNRNTTPSLSPKELADRIDVTRPVSMLRPEVRLVLKALLYSEAKHRHMPSRSTVAWALPKHKLPC